MARVFLAVSLFVFLGGCVTDHVGSGPITISPRVKSGFEKFKSWPEAEYFAVSTDGMVYGASICGDGSGTCQHSAGMVALEGCESRTTIPCKIFARDRHILWRGPVTYGYGTPFAEPEPTYKLRDQPDRAICIGLPYGNPDYLAEASRRGLKTEECEKLVGKHPAGSAVCRDRYEAPSEVVYCWRSPNARPYKTEGFCSKGDCAVTKAEYDRFLKAAMVNRLPTSRDEPAPADARPFAIIWDAYTTMAARTIELHLGTGRGTFRAPFSDTEVDCDGKYTVVEGRTGTWSVSCPDGLTAAGLFESFGIGKGARGVGLDSRGRKVRYTIGPR